MPQLNHDCAEQALVSGSVFFRNGGWYIVIEDRGDHEPINYCPYCGVKLEEPTDG